jgi:serine protease
LNPAPKTAFVAAVVAAALGAAWPASVGNATVATAKKKPTSALHEPTIRQMIVKLRNPKAVELTQPLGADRVAALSAAAGVRMTAFRPMSGHASVLKLDRTMTLAEANAVAARLAQDPNVEYASPDLPVRAYQVPQDVGYTTRLWHYYPPARSFTANGKTVPAAGGANLEGAWAVTRGSPSVVVAVIDTGVVSTHPELQGKLLPGYDFVSSDVGATAQQPLPPNFVANDGDGRDADPEDPGDWISATDVQQYPDFCGPDTADSSWHGTHMAGTIAGVWNNGVGNPPPPGTSTAGIAPEVKILPLRALGKCGGTSSDVIDAMRFAVGIPVRGAGGGLVVNPTPARIINLSLGGQGGACSPAYQHAVDDVTQRGALVIAAAGNDGGFGVSQPANCNGVLAVTAHAINGDNATYANVGPEVGISAPGGGTPTSLPTTIVSGDNGYYTWSAVLFGSTRQDSPNSAGQRGPAVGGFTGTSSATAHVSGVAALLMAAAPMASPAQVRDWIKASARPHPANGFCATGQPGQGQCGAGLLDAAAAMNLAVSGGGGSVSSGGSGGSGASGDGGGGGALPLWQWLLLAGAAFAARRRARV